MRVIGVGGQLASGKDELSNYLAEKLNERTSSGNRRWQRVGFAHAVKKVFMDTFGVSWEFIEEWKRKDEPPPGFDLPIRKCLQFIGDGFRKMKSNIWIEVALRTENNIILSDVRYINEARAIKEKGGITVLLWRPLFENDDPNPSESQIKPTIDWFVKSGLEGDVREEGIPEEMSVTASQRLNNVACSPNLFDFFIRNESSLEDLYRKVDHCLVPAIEKYYDDKSWPWSPIEQSIV
jgi:hypothetical protein